MGAIDGRLGPAPVLTNRRLDKPRPVANNFATWLAKNCAFRPILVGLRRRFPGSECRSLAKSRDATFGTLGVFGGKSPVRRVDGVGYIGFVGHRSAKRQVDEGRSRPELPGMGFLSDGEGLDIAARLCVEAEFSGWHADRLHRLDADRRCGDESDFEAPSFYLPIPRAHRFRELPPPGLLWLQDRIRDSQGPVACRSGGGLLHARATFRSPHRFSFFALEPVADLYGNRNTQ